MVKAIALLSPIYVTFFWAIIFLYQKETNNKPKYYLGFLMLLAFFLYCSHAIFFSRLYNLYSYIESIYILTMLSAYPLYYIYVLLRTTEEAGIKTQLLHFMPALVFAVLSIISTLFLNADERVFYVQDTLIDKNLKGLNFSTLTGIKGIIFFTSRFIFLVQVAIYSFEGIKRVNKHNKRVANYYSNIEGKNLNWIKNLSIIILYVAVASITFTFIGRSYFTRHEVSLIVPSVIFSIVLYAIGFNGNRQTHLLDEIIDSKDTEIPFEALITEVEDHLKTQLIELFEKNKIYQNADLRITTLAELLGTNRTYISRLINEEFAINFNEFVNKYRIEESKQLLNCKNHGLYTMEHIAEKSGFGSAASFSRVFKETEGISPGKYRDKQQNNFHDKLN